MTNDNPTFTPLKPTIGMEVHGVDLSQPVPDDAIREINDALCNNGILLFRDQDITPEQHIAFSGRFGRLEPHIATQFNLPGHPEIFIVSNIVEDGRNIGASGGARHWHFDYSYREFPSLGSLFYCVECPPEGGETQFAGMYAAHDALPDEKRQWLQDKRAVHDYVYYWENYTPHRGPLTPEQKRQLPPFAQPLVHTHPETGRRALYLAHNVISHIEGMDPEEGLEIIEELVAFATQPEFVYTHQWQERDLIFWDNRATMHRVLPFDEEQHHRRMHRTTLVNAQLSQDEPRLAQTG